MPEDTRKPVLFVGAALREVKDFPRGAMRETGFQIDLVQLGEMPDDFKPMNVVGPGTYEIRIKESGKAFRVFYVARFEEAVYVLHAFQKKTQKTPTRNIEIGKRRYQDMLELRAERGYGG